MALCADAVIGNVQEKVMKQYSTTNTEMVIIHLIFKIHKNQMHGASIDPDCGKNV